MGKSLYKYNASSQGITKVLHLLVYWQLHKLARQHHNNGLPQMAIFSHDHIGHVINVDGRYEDDYLETVFGWLCDFMPEMDQKLALDIGANIGNHAIFFSKYFKSVHAFEPNPRTFELLKFNAALVGNVITHAQGLSDKDATGTLCENPTNMGGTSIDLLSPTELSSKLSVSLKTLDSFVEQQTLGKIGLIKIDTEGFEARILKGAKVVIEVNRPVVIFELSQSDFDDNGSSEVVSILGDLGYRFLALQKNFNLGGSRMGRYASFLMRTLFGDTYHLRPVENFEQKFYQMIVAVHGATPAQ